VFWGSSLETVMVLPFTWELPVLNPDVQPAIPAKPPAYGLEAGGGSFRLLRMDRNFLLGPVTGPQAASLPPRCAHILVRACNRAPAGTLCPAQALTERREEAG